MVDQEDELEIDKQEQQTQLPHRVMMVAHLLLDQIMLMVEAVVLVVLVVTLQMAIPAVLEEMEKQV
jgi:hypothetical protein